MTNCKQDLYQTVDLIRAIYGIPALDRPLDTIGFCEPFGADVIFHDFTSDGFCGAAYAGDKRHTIMLNKNRDAGGQNFDCGHEIIHLIKHRRDCSVFKCFEKKQNTFLEWEANEGSAELIVPYKDFIPRFCSYFSDAQTSQDIWVQGALADHYGVTSQIIVNRIDSLSYEIDQYRAGVPIDEIELLSRRQRDQRGIHPTCYNAMCDFALNWDSVIG